MILTVNTIVVIHKWTVQIWACLLFHNVLKTSGSFHVVITFQLTTSLPTLIYAIVGYARASPRSNSCHALMENGLVQASVWGYAITSYILIAETRGRIGQNLDFWSVVALKLHISSVTT